MPPAPSPPAAVYCLRFMPVLVDSAARRSIKKKRGASGSARAPMRQRCAARQLAVRRSAGALAATRQKSYGYACSDVRWRSTSTTFNISTIIITYISHGGCSKSLCFWGFVCLFGSLKCCAGQRQVPMPYFGHWSWRFVGHSVTCCTSVTVAGAA